MKNKIKNFFYLEEELEEEITQAPIQQQQPVQQQPIHAAKPKKVIKERKAQIHEIVPQSTAANNNIVSLQAAMNTKGAKVVLVEPRVYAEAQDRRKLKEQTCNNCESTTYRSRTRYKNHRLFKWYSLCTWWRHSTHR